MQFIFHWRNRYLATIAVIALLVCAGCGGSSTATKSQATSGTGSGAVPTIPTPTNSISATVAPAYLTFSNQVLNSTSSFGTVTLTNTGTQDVSVSGVGITGDFAQTNNCGKTLAAAASCTVNVTFKPTALGTRTGSLSFNDSAPLSPQTVVLSGTGVAAGQLVQSPTAISFGTVTVGRASSQVLTIKNSGGENVTVTSVSTSGAGLGLNGISTPLTLAPGQTSTFTVTFDPVSVGAVSGAVYLTNSGTSPSVAVPVTGTGGTAPIHEVILAWNPSSAQVSGYNAYRGTSSGGPYTRLTASITSQAGYIDQNVTAGNSYFYVVTSVGVDMQESAFSAEVKANVPTP